MIGPTLPPHLEKKRKEEKQSGTPASIPVSSPTTYIETKITSKKELLENKLSQTVDSKKETKKTIDDDEIDEFVGPLPPSLSDKKTNNMEAKIQEIERRANPIEFEQKVETTRGDWMLVPPEPKAVADPLKVTARQFRRSDTQLERDSSIWTDTPQQRLEKIQGKVVEGPQFDYSIKARNESEQLETTECYNAKHRPKSLMEIHRESKKKKSGNKLDEDDPKNRRFDYEKDMAVKGLDPKRQMDLLKNSGRLNDRFSESKF